LKKWKVYSEAFGDSIHQVSIGSGAGGSVESGVLKWVTFILRRSWESLSSAARFGKHCWGEYGEVMKMVRGVNITEEPFTSTRRS
jgi:hypothetical protein